MKSGNSLYAGLAALALGCGQVAYADSGGTAVDGAAIADESQGANWLSYGRTYSEKRFSPLAQITNANVSQLGVDWYLDLPDARMLVNTPLVVDGVLYFEGGFAPDLRASAVVPSSISFAEVMRGSRKAMGMPSFSDLSGEELKELQHYVRGEAAPKDVP